jgi:hypothetical protein
MIEQFEFTITREDFLESGWKETIDEAQPKVIDYYFSKLSQKAKEESNVNKKAVLELLASVSICHLNVDKFHDPISNADRFSNEDLAYLAEIVNDVSDFELQARIADILWLRKRNPEMVKIAITSYLESAKQQEDFEKWTWTADRTERALQLSSMMKKDQTLLEEVIDYIFGLLDKCNGEDPLYLSAELMRLLQSKRKGDVEKYASFCEKLAKSSENQNNFDKARRYWDIKVSWHYISQDQVAARDARLKIAENYEKEADFHLHNHSTPYLMASSSLERAIMAYRNAGNSSEKVEELKLKLREYQKETSKEMVSFPIEKPDLADFIKDSVKNVSDKSFNEAIINLARSFSPLKVSNLETQAKENREKYIFGRMFPKVLQASDGRIIAREPIDENEAIHADMFADAQRMRGIYVEGIIEPSRHTISLEHFVKIQDLLPFLIDNPLVPVGREWIIAQGLHAGLNFDFLTATHLLIPQIEESFRHILIRLNIASASFDDKGIQNELNLNQFLKEEKFTIKLKEIFGEDFIFDLRGLLVERFGANLRNDMAHGLIDNNSFYTVSTIYFWWLALRFYSLLHICLLKIDNNTEEVL